MLRDAEFGGLRIRAFGTYSVRIVDALKFIREIVGTDGLFTTGEISNQLRNLINSRFASVIGGANIPVLDMAANYDQLGEFLTRRIAPEFAEYGLELTRVLVESISLPQMVSEALDKPHQHGQPAISIATCSTRAVWRWRERPPTPVAGLPKESAWASAWPWRIVWPNRLRQPLAVPQALAWWRHHHRCRGTDLLRGR